jgi:hypothetical protein
MWKKINDPHVIHNVTRIFRGMTLLEDRAAPIATQNNARYSPVRVSQTVASVDLNEAQISPYNPAAIRASA